MSYLNANLWLTSYFQISRCMIVKKNEKIILWIVDVLLFVLIIYPIFQGGLIGGYDPGFHMGRIQSLANNIASGHFPNPIGFEYLNKLGYGVGFFYGNFFIYPFAILHLLGFSVYHSYIAYIMFFVGMSIFSINFVMQKLFPNSWATIVSAPLYLTSYYVIEVIYLRAAAGELAAFAIIPWVLLSIFKLVQGKTQYWIPLSVMLGLLLVTHILSFLITVATIIIIVLLNIPTVFRKKVILWSLLKSALLFLGLTCVFLLPFLQQYSSQKFVSTSVDGNGNYLILVYSVWMKNHVFDIEQFNSMNGTLLLVLLVGSLLYYLIKNKGFHFKNKLVWQSYIVIFLYASLIVSPNLLQFAVKSFKPLIMLQVITRVNVIILPLLVFVAANALGEILGSLKVSKYAIVPVGLALLAVLTVMVPIKSNLQQVRSREQVIPQYSISMGEYEPRDFMTYNLKNNSQVTPKFLAKKQEYSITKNNHHEVQIKLDTPNDRTVLLPRLFYKGYQVTTKYAGNTLKSEAESKNGLVSTTLPPDFKSGTITVRYQTTTLGKIGWAVSLVTGLIALVIIFKRPFVKNGLSKEQN